MNHVFADEINLLPEILVDEYPAVQQPQIAQVDDKITFAPVSAPVSAPVQAETVVTQVEPERTPLSNAVQQAYGALSDSPIGLVSFS